MTSPGGADSSAGPKLTYKLISASFRDKTYADSVLLIDQANGEMELRQWTGRKKKEQTTIARFRIEPTAEVLVDGSLLRIAELSVTLESPSRAGEMADLLRMPARQRDSAKALSDAESAVSEFMSAREEALVFLAKVRFNPREALASAAQMWPADDAREPLEAVHSSYSASLGVSLEKMNSALDGAETKLGRGLVERLYALAYTTGAVQNALFESDSDLAEEIAALQELGVDTTAQDLRMGSPSERIMHRAHPVLVSLTANKVPAG